MQKLSKAHTPLASILMAALITGCTTPRNSRIESKVDQNDLTAFWSHNRELTYPRYSPDDSEKPGDTELEYYQGISARFRDENASKVIQFAKTLGRPFEMRASFDPSISDGLWTWGWPWDWNLYSRKDPKPNPIGVQWLLVRSQDCFDIEPLGARILRSGLFERVHPFPCPDGRGDGETSISLGKVTRSVFFKDPLRPNMDDLNDVVTRYLKSYYSNFGASAKVDLKKAEGTSLTYEVRAIKNFIFPRRDYWEELNIFMTFSTMFGKDELWVSFEMTGAYAGDHGGNAPPSPSKFHRLNWGESQLSSGADRFQTAFQQKFKTKTDD